MKCRVVDWARASAKRKHEKIASRVTNRKSDISEGEREKTSRKKGKEEKKLYEKKAKEKRKKTKKEKRKNGEKGKRKKKKEEGEFGRNASFSVDSPLI